MKMKKLISFLCAAALTVSSFAGLAVTASAETPKSVTVAVDAGDTTANVTTTESSAVSGVLLLAKYSNNALTSLNVSGTFTTPQENVALGATYAAGDKIMAWNSLAGMEPLTVTVVAKPIPPTAVSTVAELALTASNDGKAPATITAAVTAKQDAEFEDRTSFTYVWTKDNEPVADATSATLEDATAGTYTVTATYNGDGNYEGSLGPKTITIKAADDNRTTLDNAKVTVTPAGDVYKNTELTAAVTIPGATEEDDAVTVSATDLDYAWSKKGDSDAWTPVDGATAATFTPTEVGTYKVTVTAKAASENYVGTVSSAEINVIIPADYVTSTDGKVKAISVMGLSGKVVTGDSPAEGTDVSGKTYKELKELGAVSQEVTRGTPASHTGGQTALTEGVILASSGGDSPIAVIEVDASTYKTQAATDKITLNIKQTSTVAVGADISIAKVTSALSKDFDKLTSADVKELTLGTATVIDSTGNGKVSDMAYNIEDDIAALGESDTVLYYVVTVASGRETKLSDFAITSATYHTASVTSGITGGTVTADKTSKLVAGDKVTVTIAATEGYDYTADSLSVKDASNAAVTVTAVEGQDGKYEFTMPDSNVTITAAFAQIQLDPSVVTINYKNGEDTVKTDTVNGYIGRAIDLTGKLEGFNVDNAGGATFKHYTINSGATTSVTPASATETVDVAVSTNDKDYYYYEDFETSSTAGYEGGTKNSSLAATNKTGDNTYFALANNGQSGGRDAYLTLKGAKAISDDYVIEMDLALKTADGGDSTVYLAGSGTAANASLLTLTGAKSASVWTLANAANTPTYGFKGITMAAYGRFPENPDNYKVSDFTHIKITVDFDSTTATVVLDNDSTKTYTLTVPAGTVLSQVYGSFARYSSGAAIDNIEIYKYTAPPAPTKVALTGVTLAAKTAGGEDVADAAITVGTVLAATIAPENATGVTYEWYRGDDKIADAAAATYIVTAEDQGKTIKVVAKDNQDTPTTKEASKAIPAASTPSTKTALTGVTIDGTAKVGETLTATVAPTDATATYQWKAAAAADGEYTNITGATNATYELTANEQGKFIKVEATGSGDYDTTVTSEATAAVAAATNPKTDVTATAEIAKGDDGVTLTASVKDVTPEAAADAFTVYAWTRSATEDGTYTAVENALGKTITAEKGYFYKVAISIPASNETYNAKTVTSAAVEVPADPVAQATTATITAVAADKSMYGKTLGDLTDGFTITGTDKAYTAKGTLKYVTGYTDFSSNTDEQSGNYLPFVVTVDGYNEASTIKIKGNAEGSTEQVYNYADYTDGFFVFILGGQSTSLTIKVDRDGAGTEYTEETYTLSWEKATSADEADKLYFTPAPTPITAVAITGTTTIGETLTAKTTPEDATAAYVWKRADAVDGEYAAIEGATSKTYKLTAADANKYIKVVATAGEGYTGEVTSDASAQIAEALLALTDGETVLFTADTLAGKLDNDSKIERISDEQNYNYLTTYKMQMYPVRINNGTATKRLSANKVKSDTTIGSVTYAKDTYSIKTGGTGTIKDGVPQNDVFVVKAEENGVLEVAYEHGSNISTDPRNMRVTQGTTNVDAPVRGADKNYMQVNVLKDELIYIWPQSSSASIYGVKFTADNTVTATSLKKTGAEVVSIIAGDANVTDIKLTKGGVDYNVITQSGKTRRITKVDNVNCTVYDFAVPEAGTYTIVPTFAENYGAAADSATSITTDGTTLSYTATVKSAAVTSDKPDAAAVSGAATVNANGETTYTVSLTSNGSPSSYSDVITAWKVYTTYTNETKTEATKSSIDANGKLTVGLDETATTLYVVATVTDNAESEKFTDLTATKEVTVNAQYVEQTFTFARQDDGTTAINGYAEAKATEEPNTGWTLSALSLVATETTSGKVENGSVKLALNPNKKYTIALYTDDSKTTKIYETTYAFAGDSEPESKAVSVPAAPVPTGDSLAGTTLSPAGAVAGDEVTITVPADADKQVDSVEVYTAADESDETKITATVDANDATKYTFTMPEGGINHVKVNTTDLYQVTLTNTANATVKKGEDAFTTSKVPANTEITISGEAAIGYTRTIAITKDEDSSDVKSDVYNSETGVVTVPEYAITITITDAINTYTAAVAEVAADANYTVELYVGTSETAENADATVNYGTAVTYKVTPAENYEVTSVTFNGTTYTGTEDGEDTKALPTADAEDGSLSFTIDSVTANVSAPTVVVAEKASPITTKWTAISGTADTDYTITAAQDGDDVVTTLTSKQDSDINFAYDLKADLNNLPTTWATATGELEVSYELYVDNATLGNPENWFMELSTAKQAIGHWGGAGKHIFGCFGSHGKDSNYKFIGGSETTLNPDTKYEFVSANNTLVKGEWKTVTYKVDLKNKKVFTGKYGSDDAVSLLIKDERQLTDDNLYLVFGFNQNKNAETKADSAIKVKNVTVSYSETPTEYTIAKSNEEATYTIDKTKANAGDTVTVSAPDGSTITAFTVAGAPDAAIAEDGLTATFTMPAQNVTIEATVAAAAPSTYNVTFALGGGKVGESTDDVVKTVDAGGKVASADIPVPEKEGAVLAGWKNGDNTYTADDIAKAEVNAAITYTAQWTSVYTVTISDAENGSVMVYAATRNGEEGSYTYTKGDKITGDALTTIEEGTLLIAEVDPTEGYQVKSLTVATASDLDSDNTTYTFSMPAGNVTVSAEFEFVTNVTITADGTYIDSATDTADTDNRPTVKAGAAKVSGGAITSQSAGNSGYSTAGILSVDASKYVGRIHKATLTIAAVAEGAKTTLRLGQYANYIDFAENDKINATNIVTLGGTAATVGDIGEVQTSSTDLTYDITSILRSSSNGKKTLFLLTSTARMVTATDVKVKLEVTEDTIPAAAVTVHKVYKDNTNGTITIDDTEDKYVEFGTNEEIANTAGYYVGDNFTPAATYTTAIDDGETSRYEYVSGVAVVELEDETNDVYIVYNKIDYQTTTFSVTLPAAAGEGGKTVNVKLAGTPTSTGAAAADTNVAVTVAAGETTGTATYKLLPGTYTYAFVQTEEYLAKDAASVTVGSTNAMTLEANEKTETTATVNYVTNLSDVENTTVKTATITGIYEGDSLNIEDASYVSTYLSEFKIDNTTPADTFKRYTVNAYEADTYKIASLSATASNNVINVIVSTNNKNYYYYEDFSDYDLGTAWSGVTKASNSKTAAVDDSNIGSATNVGAQNGLTIGAKNKAMAWSMHNKATQEITRPLEGSGSVEVSFKMAVNSQSGKGRRVPIEFLDENGNSLITIYGEGSKTSSTQGIAYSIDGGKTFTRVETTGTDASFHTFDITFDMTNHKISLSYDGVAKVTNENMYAGTTEAPLTLGANVASMHTIQSSFGVLAGVVFDDYAVSQYTAE